MEPGLAKVTKFALFGRPGALLATLSVVLRFWDLFVIRAILYPLYIANAPHARFETLRCRPLPVFHLAFGVINGGLQLVELRSRS